MGPFLQIRCLEEVKQQVEVINISPIPASIRCVVKSKYGYFTVINPELTLESGASKCIEIVAVFVEAVAATGTLLISVIDGQDLSVSLRGQVIGVAAAFSCKSMI